jgi:hypothetical protein
VKAGASKAVAAHQFPREENGHYVEPDWCDRVLFENEKFEGEIFDPCCGFGTVVKAARAAGHVARGSDMVDRAFPGAEVCDFLADYFPFEPTNIVMNPPFSLGEKFCRKACAVTFNKVACILPAGRLNAAHWLRALPLVRIWYLTPRPSMLPGYMLARGEKAKGGKEDYCWLIFDNSRPKEFRHWMSSVGWLHRDRGAL